MSSEDQEGSIEQQRAEVRKFAEGRYNILREYVDAGKSGSKDQEKRLEFRRMLLDSAGGEWSVVLVWKSNRFGRLDSLEGADAKATLRKNGVAQLVSVREGVFDWTTRIGRMMDCFHSEANNEYAASLASDSIRGRLAALDKGFWVNGSVPYAYHRQYIAPDGRDLVIPRTQSFRKPEGWLLRLVIAEDEAAIVRWCFDRLVNHDASLRSLAHDLNRRGVPSPTALGKGKGHCWTETMMISLLTQPAYIGVGYLGTGRGRRPGKFSLAGDVRRAGVCPVIVDPELWEQAQAVLAGRRRHKRHPTKGSGALSGVLICAHCGWPLSATHWKGKVKYVCNSPSQYPGKYPCRQWGIYEEDILPRVCAKLVEVVDGELLKALAAEPPAALRLGDVDLARRQMAQLEKQIDSAADRYLKAPADLMPRLEVRLRALRQELAGLEEKVQTLAAEAGQGAVVNFTKWWQGVRGRLLVVPATPAAVAFQNFPAEDFPGEEDAYVLAEPAALRSLLVRLGIHVVCTFAEGDGIRRTKPGRGRGPKYLLKRAVLTWPGQARPDEEVASTYQ
jgi:DNA invertase Pin-like site-specific DNA recombinase